MDWGHQPYCCLKPQEDDGLVVMAWRGTRALQFIPHLEPLWQTDPTRRSQIFVFQDFGPNKNVIVGVFTYNSGC